MSEIKETVHHIKYKLVLDDEATVLAKTKSEAYSIMYAELLREPMLEGMTREEFGFRMIMEEVEDENV